MMDELNLRLIRSAEYMVASIDKMYEITHKLESENASRVVWLVGLSGFAIINMPNIVSGNLSLSITELLPWFITVVCGVIAHWLHRHVSIQNFSIFIVKRENLLTFIINGPNSATFNDLEKILTNKTDKLKKISKSHGRATTLATVMELATFASFVVSLMTFIWKIIPLLYQPGI